MAKVDNILKGMGFTPDALTAAAKAVAATKKPKGLADAMMAAGQSIEINTVKSVATSFMKDSTHKLVVHAEYTYKMGDDVRDAGIKLCYDLKLKRFTDVLN